MSGSAPPPSEPGSSRPTTSVVVVTWNSVGTIEQCLAPLAHATDLELIVVDNASSDDTLALAGQVAPRAVRLTTGGNCGFAAGVDAGAEVAGGDVLVLLNPDAVADADTLRRLADEVRAGAAVAAPAITDVDGHRVRSTRRRPTVRDQWVVALGLHRVIPALDPDDDGGARAATTPVDVEVVSGACLATGADRFARLGGLDRRFFLYGEEVDYCRRVAAEGGAIRYHPELEVHHIGGASASLTGSGTDAVLKESRVRWFAKHRSRTAARAVRLALLVAALLRLGPAAAVDLLRPATPRWRRTRGTWASVRAMVRPLDTILTPTHPLAEPRPVD